MLFPHTFVERKQGVDFRGDATILSDGPNRAVVELEQVRDALFGLLIWPTRQVWI